MKNKNIIKKLKKYRSLFPPDDFMTLFAKLSFVFVIFQAAIISLDHVMPDYKIEDKSSFLQYIFYFTPLLLLTSTDRSFLLILLTIIGLPMAVFTFLIVFQFKKAKSLFRMQSARLCFYGVTFFTPLITLIMLQNLICSYNEEYAEFRQYMEGFTCFVSPFHYLFLFLSTILFLCSIFLSAIFQVITNHPFPYSKLVNSSVSNFRTYFIFQKIFLPAVYLGFHSNFVVFVKSVNLLFNLYYLYDQFQYIYFFYKEKALHCFSTFFVMLCILLDIQVICGLLFDWSYIQSFNLNQCIIYANVASFTTYVLMSNLLSDAPVERMNSIADLRRLINIFNSFDNNFDKFKQFKSFILLSRLHLTNCSNEYCHCSMEDDKIFLQLARNCVNDTISTSDKKKLRELVSKYTEIVFKALDPGNSPGNSRTKLTLFFKLSQISIYTHVIGNYFSAIHQISALISILQRDKQYIYLLYGLILRKLIFDRYHKLKIWKQLYAENEARALNFIFEERMFSKALFGNIAEQITTKKKFLIALCSNPIFVSNLFDERNALYEANKKLFRKLMDGFIFTMKYTEIFYVLKIFNMEANLKSISNLFEANNNISLDSSVNKNRGLLIVKMTKNNRLLIDYIDYSILAHLNYDLEEVINQDFEILLCHDLLASFKDKHWFPSYINQANQGRIKFPTAFCSKNGYLVSFYSTVTPFIKERSVYFIMDLTYMEVKNDKKYSLILCNNKGKIISHDKFFVSYISEHYFHDHNIQKLEDVYIEEIFKNLKFSDILSGSVRVKDFKNLDNRMMVFQKEKSSLDQGRSNRREEENYFLCKLTMIETLSFLPRNYHILLTKFNVEGPKINRSKSRDIYRKKSMVETNISNSPFIRDFYNELSQNKSKDKLSCFDRVKFVMLPNFIMVILILIFVVILVVVNSTIHRTVKVYELYQNLSIFQSQYIRKEICTYLYIYHKEGIITNENKPLLEECLRNEAVHIRNSRQSIFSNEFFGFIEEDVRMAIEVEELNFFQTKDKKEIRLWDYLKERENAIFDVLDYDSKCFEKFEFLDRFELNDKKAPELACYDLLNNNFEIFYQIMALTINSTLELSQSQERNTMIYFLIFFNLAVVVNLVNIFIVYRIIKEKIDYLWDFTEIEKELDNNKMMRKIEFLTQMSAVLKRFKLNSPNTKTDIKQLRDIMNNNHVSNPMDTQSIRSVPSEKASLKRRGSVSEAAPRELVLKKNVNPFLKYYIFLLVFLIIKIIIVIVTFVTYFSIYNGLLNDVSYFTDTLEKYNLASLSLLFNFTTVMTRNEKTVGEVFDKTFDEMYSSEDQSILINDKIQGDFEVRSTELNAISRTSVESLYASNSYTSLMLTDMCAAFENFASTKVITFTEEDAVRCNELFQSTNAIGPDELVNTYMENLKVVFNERNNIQSAQFSQIKATLNEFQMKEVVLMYLYRISPANVLYSYSIQSKIDEVYGYLQSFNTVVILINMVDNLFFVVILHFMLIPHLYNHVYRKKFTKDSIKNIQAV